MKMLDTGLAETPEPVEAETKAEPILAAEPVAEVADEPVAEPEET